MEVKNIISESVRSFKNSGWRQIAGVPVDGFRPHPTENSFRLNTLNSYSKLVIEFRSGRISFFFKTRIALIIHHKQHHPKERLTINRVISVEL